MKLYQKDRYQPFKWIFGIFVFVMAMTFTVDEAEGFYIPKSMQSQVTSVDETTDKYAVEEFDYLNAGVSDFGGDTYEHNPDQPSSTVPEPTTIILMAMGIGALRVARKFQSVK